MGCTSLETATLSDNLTMIGGYTFQNCSSLKTVKLPSNLEVWDVLFFPAVRLNHSELRQ